jgi:LysR family transcriptional regulator, transcriptional activator of the cysJI operon
MRPFQKLDPISLKAFYFAAEKLNFTRAAEAAALTQSGVSQHISKLESELGTELFHRTRKSVHLTPAGIELRKFIETYLDSVDSLFDRLTQEGNAARGQVRYAMPESCLYTPHFETLLDRRSNDFGAIDLRVHICESEEVVRLLRDSEIDFGFVNKPLEGRDVELTEFAREEYIIVTNDRKLRQISTPQSLKEIPFINYPGMDALLDSWFQAEFPRAKPVRIDEMWIKGEINNLKGAVAMVKKGVGAAVFQKQCVSAELDARSLYQIQTRNDRGAENQVFVLTLKNSKPPARVQAVINAFHDMKRARR